MIRFLNGNGSSLLMNINFMTVGNESSVYLISCEVNSRHRAIYGIYTVSMYGMTDH